MYKMIPWSKNLDLSTFYEQARLKGFSNNSTQDALVHCFDNEKEKQIWILYFNSTPIGSVAAHSLELFEPNSYRICARTCVLDTFRKNRGLGTKNQLIVQHQNITDQFYIPTAIEWAGIENNLYISTHDSNFASQSMVHRTYCPTMERMGLLENIGEVFYRGHQQTFWRLNSQKFLDDIKKYPSWN